MPETLRVLKWLPMENSRKKWSLILGGSEANFSLEHRILNFILLVASVCFIFGIVSTFIFDLPINAIDFLAFPTYAITYIISRHGKQFVIAMVLFTLANLSMFNFSWLASHGLNGPLLYLLLTFIFLNFALMNFKIGSMVNSIFLADAIALIFLEGSSSGYTSELQRKIDFSLHVVLVTAFFAFVTNFLKRAYLQERQRSKEHWHQKLNLQNNMINDSKVSALGRLAIGIAHEIIVPLNSIKKSAEASRETINKPPINLITFDRLHQQILADVATIKETTECLLRFSQIETNEPEWVNINDLINESILLTKINLQSLGANYQIEISPNARTVWGVRSQLLTVITNLLLNCKDAFEKTDDKKPVIEIKSELKPNKISLSIKDNGKGLSEAEQKKLFDPFQQESSSATLSLPIIYGIIKLHNGEIEVDTQEGLGTEFKILLPHKTE